jgi:division protein CdvB (Snf7/Vps24/ESCRT-III family)
LSSKFSEKWEAKERSETNFGDKVKAAFHPTTSLRQQLDFAIRRLEAQVQRMDATTTRLSNRGETIFSEIVAAYSKHDLQHARVLANELSGIRKLERTLISARLALEQVVIRLNTVSDLGGMVSNLAPAVLVLRRISASIGGVIPDTGRELNQISNILGGIVMDSDKIPGLSINFEGPNADAQRILAEASTVAEHRMKEKFPDSPSGASASGDKSRTKA